MSAAVTSYTNVVCPPLGESIPATLPHAISVSLPTWKDNVGYEEGEKRVIDTMRTGYPRFFVHKTIEKVSIRYLSIVYVLLIWPKARLCRRRKVRPGK